MNLKVHKLEGESFDPIQDGASRARSLLARMYCRTTSVTGRCSLREWLEPDVPEPDQAPVVLQADRAGFAHLVVERPAGELVECPVVDQGNSVEHDCDVPLIGHLAVRPHAGARNVMS